MLNGESAKLPGRLTQHLFGAPAEAQEKKNKRERENRAACMRQRQRGII